MSQNCKSTYTAATARDANNNTLYSAGPLQGYGGRTFAPPNVTSNGNYQQVTAKVMFAGVTAVNDLKLPEREVRRTH